MGSPGQWIVDNFAIVDNRGGSGLPSRPPGEECVKITEVEAIVLRQPASTRASQTAARTISSSASTPTRASPASARSTRRRRSCAALVQAARARTRSPEPAGRLIGQDPLDIERLLDRRCTAGLIYSAGAGSRCMRSAASTSRCGTSRARRSGKPVCELLGTPQRDRVRAYASTPDARHRGRGARERQRPAASRASPRSSSAGARSGRTRQHDVGCSRRPRKARLATTSTILIDAGHGYVDDAEDRDRGRARAGGSSACSGWRSRSCPTSTRRTPSSPTRSTSASRRASRTRRAGASGS